MPEGSQRSLKRKGHDEDEESLLTDGSENGKIHDDREQDPIDLDEDTFGMTLCSLIRDSFWIARDDEHTHARYVRLLVMLGLCFLTIVCQVWLLAEVKAFVSSRAVHDIRIAYDLYEQKIYGKENCIWTVNGKCRGDLTKVNPTLEEKKARLAELSFKDQDDICRIPLSQPYFFALILIIWTMTCLSEFRKAYTLCSNLMRLPSLASMHDAFEISDSQPKYEVMGLTVLMKIFVVVITLVRIGITGFLLWVGCRWLLATNCFADLILNAVALEFILLLKEAFYMTLVPTRSKIDVTETKIHPCEQELNPGVAGFVGTVALFLVAVAWVVAYMLVFQQVLPGYLWDVHDPCKDFIKKRFEV